MVNIDRSTLAEAKAFLCWDIFPQLSIQLVEVKGAVSFYYPPGPRSTIIVYYAQDSTDFTIPLFHLFHEAGHHLQYTQMQDRNRTGRFWKIADIPTGRKKTDFERASWKEGRYLLSRFIREKQLPHALLVEYDAYALECIQSYR